MKSEPEFGNAIAVNNDFSTQTQSLTKKREWKSGRSYQLIQRDWKTKKIDGKERKLLRGRGNLSEKNVLYVNQSIVILHTFIRLRSSHSMLAMIRREYLSISTEYIYSHSSLLERNYRIWNRSNQYWLLSFLYQLSSQHVLNSLEKIFKHMNDSRNRTSYHHNLAITQFLREIFNIVTYPYVPKSFSLDMFEINQQRSLLRYNLWTVGIAIENHVLLQWSKNGSIEDTYKDLPEHGSLKKAATSVRLHRFSFSLLLFVSIVCGSIEWLPVSVTRLSSLEHWC